MDRQIRTPDDAPSSMPVMSLMLVGQHMIDELRLIRVALEALSPLGAAKQTAGSGPQEITVPLDEAVQSPYLMNGYPLVRYQLPDKRWIRWGADAGPEGEPIVRLFMDDPQTGERWALRPDKVQDADGH